MSGLAAWTGSTLRSASLSLPRFVRQLLCPHVSLSKLPPRDLAWRMVCLSGELASLQPPSTIVRPRGLFDKWPGVPSFCHVSDHAPFGAHGRRSFNSISLQPMKPHASGTCSSSSMVISSSENEEKSKRMSIDNRQLRDYLTYIHVDITCIRSHLCVPMRIPMRVQHTLTHMHVRMRSDTCTHTRIMHVCMYACTHIRFHIHIYTSTRIHLR